MKKLWILPIAAMMMVACGGATDEAAHEEVMGDVMEEMEAAVEDAAADMEDAMEDPAADMEDAAEAVEDAVEAAHDDHEGH